MPRTPRNNTLFDAPPAPYTGMWGHSVIKMSPPVTSLPVPLVVPTSTTGFGAFCHTREYSPLSSMSGFAAARLRPLPRQGAEPPPMPTTKSAPNSAAMRPAARHDSTVGFGATPE